MSDFGDGAKVRQSDSELVDVSALVRDLWTQRWVIIIVAMIIFAAAVTYLNLKTYTYTAELKVTPVQTGGSGGSNLGGLAGLAAIAGVSLPQSAGISQFQLYTESLTSRAVAERLAARDDIMRTIFEGEWDKRTQRFAEPKRGPVGRLVLELKTLLGIPTYPWQAPDAAELQVYIEGNVHLIQNAKSSVVTITYDNKDPRFAVVFLNAIHSALDASLRQKALTRANQYIAYLSNQLQRVTLAEHRTAIAQALSEQEKTRMMASSQLAFAAEPFGSAIASLRPTNPKPMIALLLGVVLGLAAGMAAAVVRLQWRNGRDEDAIMHN